jgi:hypothetical protein
MDKKEMGENIQKLRHRIGDRHNVLVWITLIVILALGLGFVNIVVSNLGLEEKPALLGATFSKIYAKELGIDWKEAYTAMLDDLKVRNFRLAAYWSEIEPEPDVFDFTDLDWQINEASRRGAKVILAIGRKLPRWPECHVPKWSVGLDEELVRARILSMLDVVVRRYASNPTVVAWQVENEPFFEFGECPQPDIDFLRQEIAAVRSLDARPVVISESGELSTWVRAASLADILGISTYRIVWSRFTGYFYWPVTPKVYQQRALAASALVKKIIITELQGEPWTTQPIISMPLDQQLKLMNPDRLTSNVIFARKIGVSEIYLWGVEWWYWLKQQGQPEMWEAATTLFLSPQNTIPSTVLP